MNKLSNRLYLDTFDEMRLAQKLLYNMSVFELLYRIVMLQSISGRRFVGIFSFSFLVRVPMITSMSNDNESNVIDYFDRFSCDA
jgi:hypothetical protein